MADQEGFEPSVAINYAPFPGVCLKPLGHRSKINSLRIYRYNFQEIIFNLYNS